MTRPFLGPVVLGPVVATTAARPPLPYVLAEIDDEWLATVRRYLTWEDRA
jgi:hypothetical protein